MKKYPLLSKLFYSDPTLYEQTYQERFNSDYAHRLKLMIGKHPAFFVVTPEIQKTVLTILRTDKRIAQLQKSLPPIAIEQFALRCLMDEIVLTNKIEGVVSTRREVRNAIWELRERDSKHRFYGLVQKYMMLSQNQTIPINTCEDIRVIYDDLLLEEIKNDNPENLPDGKIFRKDNVSVQSPTQKEIHRGIFPEEEIIRQMSDALDFLNDNSEELLYRIAVFHYFLGYIHPFYDGNGRLNRFISSYMLSRELEPILGYRLSYTIKENIDSYYEAFKVCNAANNRGDLTPFISMFLDILETSVTLLESALQKRFEQLQYYFRIIPHLTGSEHSDLNDLYGYLVQAQLFSDYGISTTDLLNLMNFSRETLRKRLALISAKKLLVTKRMGKSKFYGIDLNELDNIITTLNPHA